MVFSHGSSFSDGTYYNGDATELFVALNVPYNEQLESVLWELAFFLKYGEESFDDTAQQGLYKTFVTILGDKNDPTRASRHSALLQILSAEVSESHPHKKATVALLALVHQDQGFRAIRVQQNAQHSPQGLSSPFESERPMTGNISETRAQKPTPSKPQQRERWEELSDSVHGRTHAPKTDPREEQLKELMNNKVNHAPEQQPSSHNSSTDPTQTKKSAQPSIEGEKPVTGEELLGSLMSEEEPPKKRKENPNRGNGLLKRLMGE